MSLLHPAMLGNGLTQQVDQPQGVAPEGQQLRDAAEALPRRGLHVLEGELHYLAGCQGQPEKIRRRDAITFASVVGNTDVRRGLLGSMERANLSRIETSEVEHISQLDPLLQPVAALALT